MKSFFAENPAALADFCVHLVPQLSPGTIVCLQGELGAGKTTLVRSLVEALGGSGEQVHSPTFGLVHHYQCPKFNIIHCDFYRLGDGSLLPELGGLEFFSENAVYCLEWPERVEGLLAQVPNKTIIVKITMSHPGRTLEVFPD